MGHKLGLMLASVHTGLSKRFWKSFAQLQEEKGDTWFVFPGGRLSCTEGYEYLRGTVYPLANKKNIQGLVCWASSLGGFVSSSEVVSFISQSDVPFVTYGLEAKGHPFVGFDSYGGMRQVVSHLVEVHGARKIAFLRGPRQHQGAQDRFAAYQDVLRQKGIEYDARLVSSPYAWTMGREAVKELLDDRHLVPGVDFDTLVASSDLMLFEASKVLSSRGVRIPETLRTAGFNDTEESLLVGVPCTTAHMPVEEICRKAYDAIGNLVDGKPEPQAGTILPMQLSIRSSCGCDSTLDKTESRKFAEHPEAFVAWLEKTFPKALVEEMAVEVRAGRNTAPVMTRYLEEGGDALLVLDAIRQYFQLDKDTAGRLYGELLEAKTLADSQERYLQSRQSDLLNSLKNKLLCTRSLVDIVPLCQDILPKLHMQGMYLVLGGVAGSRFVGGFDGTTRYTNAEDFDPGELLPKRLLDGLAPAVYAVEPLFMENQPLGYVVLRTDKNTRTELVEEVRTSLSSAIKGTLLLEEANQAKEAAEQAERQRSAFLANVNESLQGPVMNLVRQVQDPVARKELSHALRVVDMALSQTTGLELDCKLEVLAPGLPPVLVDEETLGQIDRALEDWIGPFQKRFEVTEEGLVLHYAADNPSGEEENSQARELAERLTLLLGGTFRHEKGGVRLCLHWPSMAGKSPLVEDKKGSKVYALGCDGSPFPAAALKPEQLGDSLAALADCRLLVVDAGQTSYDLSLAVHRISQSMYGTVLPVLCLHFPEGAATIEGALQSGERNESGHIVAVCGNLPSGLEKLTLPGDFRTFSDLPSFLGVPSPALCVMDHKDLDLVAAIRGKSQVPILVMLDKVTEADALDLSGQPGVAIADSCIAQSDDFLERMRDIISGGQMLAPLTGVLVKKAIAYLDAHATEALSRWQLAEAINVSEDYLTRIFRRELGLSPWDYLTRIRVSIATKLLRQTTYSVGEVASRSGFQDQAYFCRVFKKATGVNPGKLRQRQA